MTTPPKHPAAQINIFPRGLGAGLLALVTKDIRTTNAPSADRTKGGPISLTVLFPLPIFFRETLLLLASPVFRQHRSKHSSLRRACLARLDMSPVGRAPQLAEFQRHDIGEGQHKGSFHNY